MEKNNKLLGVERCVILQAIAEYYLFRTTGKHFADEYPGVQEEYGVLLEQHIRLLKEYLKDEFNARGIDLNQCIEKSGEKVILENKLTKYEVEVLVRDADLVLSSYCMVEERKKRLLKK